MRVYSHITGPILEGSRGQDPLSFTPISATPDVARHGDDADCRSDPTFTRASPGLAVAEQLPQTTTTTTTTTTTNTTIMMMTMMTTMATVTMTMMATVMMKMMMNKKN